MLIGIDARYGLRSNRRGIGNYIYHLLDEFRRIQPPKFRFILYGDTKYDRQVAASFKEEFFSINILPGSNPVWWEQVFLPIAAVRDGINLLHCTSNIAPLGIKPWRLVTTIHDVIEFHRKLLDDARPSLNQRLARVYRNGVLPRVVKMSDAVLTVSEFSRADIAKMLNIDPGYIRVTYEAASIKEEIKNPSDEKLCLRELGIHDQYIFSFGATDTRKNTARLIEAYQKLRAETNTKVSLVVTGIEKPGFFTPSIDKGIYLFSFLPEEVVAILLKHALFFVYPSLYEGFGLPVLDAMKSRTPVLCSASTAVAEIAADAALQFDPRNVDELATKMRVLLEDHTLRAELIKKGAAREKQFSWNRCARETFSVYEELLSGTR